MPDKRFEAELDQFMSEFTQEASHFAPQIAEQLLTELIDTGPYWSGKLIASWVVSLNGPVDYSEDSIPNMKGAMPREQAKQAALSTPSYVKDATVGQTIFITNGAKSHNDIAYTPLVNAGEFGTGNYIGWIDLALVKFQGLIDAQVHF